MAIRTERNGLTTVREHEIPDLPKQQPKIRRSKKDIFSGGKIPISYYLQLSSFFSHQ